MSTNLPLGSYVQDGVRSGPLYSGAVPASLLSFNPTETLSYGAYSAYGPGVLYSPQFTWNIVPNVASNAGDFSITTNLVAPTAAADITQAGNLQIRGDNNVTVYVGGASPYVQFDWPRVPTVTIANAVAGNRNVTIFGKDWYGNPLQHTYAVEATGTYPTVNTHALTVPAKAFYTVNRVFINGGLAGGSTISLGASDIFGLPYLVNNAGDITSIGWGTVSDLSTLVAGQPLTYLGAFAAGDVTSPPTAATTGDVRGLYAPSSASDGIKRLRFTYYVMGADVWLNQVANAQFYAQANNQPLVGVPVKSLTPQALYGLPQFYTGNPS